MSVKQIHSNTIQKELENEDSIFILNKANHNTLQNEIKSNKIVHFEKENSIAALLGFKRRTLSINNLHISDFPINNAKMNSIRTECNLLRNSYNNDPHVHILHIFYPNVPSGYRIIENVSNVIYLPMNTNYIDEVTTTIVDQDGNIVNCNKELITMGLHLKEL